MAPRAKAPNPHAPKRRRVPPSQVFTIEAPDHRGRPGLVTVGEMVRVLPSPGRRDGFDARFRSARMADGEVSEVEVYGGRKGRAALRTFPPERIERITKQPEQRVAS